MLATVLHRTTGYTGELILGDGTVLEFLNGQAGPATITFADAQSLTVMGYSVVTADPPPPTNDPFDVKAASLVPAGHVLGDALRSGFVPKWKPSTAYASGEFVLNPSGQVVSANTAFTSGTTYSAGNWTVVSGGGGGAVSSVAGRTGAVVLAAGDVSGLSTVATTGAYADLSGKPTIPATQAVQATSTTSGALVVNAHNPVDATSAAKTMTLPTGQAQGTVLSVEKEDATANAVTITGNIRGVGSSSLALVWQYESVTFIADSSGSWWPRAGHKTKASLDAAYVATPTLDKQSTAAPTTLMTDSFTGTAGTALQGGHTTDQGGAWTGRTGTAFVLSGDGHATFASTTYTDPSIHTTDLTTSNYTITQQLTPQVAGSPGLVVRYVSTSNYLYVSVDPSSLLVRIYRGTAYLVAASMPSITAGTPITLRVDCYGPDVTVWVNGVEIVTVDDAQNITSKTIGLRGGKTTGTAVTPPSWGPITVTTYQGTRRNWPRFAKYVSNPLIPLGTTGAYDDTDINNPNVCFDPVNNRWVLYYSGYHDTGTHNNQQKMCLAYSTTGPFGPWTKDGANPVYDSYATDFNTENGGLCWHPATQLWAHAYHAGSNQKRIGFGTSTDLHTWTRVGYLPSTAGTWDAGGQYDPFLRVREDGVTLECWYAGADSGGARSIGRMTSIDGGQTWVTESSPVLSNPGISAIASFAEPSVWVPPGREGQQMAIFTDLAMLSGGTDRVIAMHITSDGGATWRSRVVSRPSAATWESKQVYDSFPLFYDGRLYLFHSGSPASGLVLNMGIQIGVDATQSFDPQTLFVGAGGNPTIGTAVSAT